MKTIIIGLFLIRAESNIDVAGWVALLGSPPLSGDSGAWLRSCIP